MRKKAIRELLSVWEEFGHKKSMHEGGKKVSPEVEEMGNKIKTCVKNKEASIIVDSYGWE